MREYQKFLLSEYDYLRKEIERLSAEMRALARYALVITGAVYSWFAARLLDPAVEALDATFRLFAWAPAVLALLFAVRWGALLYGVKRIAGYIEKVEADFNLPQDLGWENHLRRTRKPIMFWSAIFYWVVLIAITSLSPFFIKFQ